VRPSACACVAVVPCACMEGNVRWYHPAWCLSTPRRRGAEPPWRRRGAGGRARGRAAARPVRAVRADAARPAAGRPERAGARGAAARRGRRARRAGLGAGAARRRRRCLRLPAASAGPAACVGAARAVPGGQGGPVCPVCDGPGAGRRHAAGPAHSLRMQPACCLRCWAAPVWTCGACAALSCPCDLRARLAGTATAGMGCSLRPQSSQALQASADQQDPSPCLWLFWRLRVWQTSSHHPLRCVPTCTASARLQWMRQAHGLPVQHDNASERGLARRLLQAALGWRPVQQQPGC